MRGLLSVTRDSYLLLRRDRIFVPAAIGGALVAFFANLASDWTIEEWTKVLFDIGAFGFNLIGSLVAIFWSTKSVADARSEGFLEVQMATPVSRSTWLVGKYLGLVLSLVTLGVLLGVLWQGFMLVNDFGKLNADQLLVFTTLLLGWCVLGSAGIFFASFCSHGTSLFSTISLWLVGLASPTVLAALSPETDIITRTIVENVAWAWDLQRFNLADTLTIEGHATENLKAVLQWNSLYGIATIAILLTASSLIFRKRDLIA